MENKRVKDKIDIIIIAIIFLLIIYGFAKIASWINNIYRETNNLAFYLINLIFQTNLAIVILLIIFSTCLAKNKIINVISGIFILPLVLFLIGFFYMPKTLKYVKINDTRPSISKYKYEIFKDVIEDKTTIITIPNTDISATDDTVFTGTRHRIKTNRSYISYIKENNKYAVESSKALNIAINKLKSLKEEIEIEYYNNSGIIKKVEGIELYDYESFAYQIAKLTVQVFEETEQKRIDAEKLQQKEMEERNKKSAFLYKLKQNAIGKKFDSIKKELEKNQIVDYSIKYISSKMYSVGEIAFIDTKEGCVFYIVKDNRKEDMVKMPDIKPGMTEKEIMDKLNKSGLKGYVYITSKTDDYKKKGTLQYYSYSPGTLLPKGLKVGFSIYE